MIEKVIIMGAAGRDFHNFNVYFKDNPRYNVVAFTAAQIPDIAGRLYPPELAGKSYPDGISIYPEDELAPFISDFLQQNNFDPTSVSDEKQAQKAYFPPELLEEAPNLLVLLDRWRMVLRQQDEYSADPQWNAIESALSELIGILTEAKQH